MSDGWKIEMWVDGGRAVVRDWIDGLHPHQRAAVVAAIDVSLRRKGPDICQTEYGKQLGGGLFELRIRQDADTIRRKAGEPSRGEPSGVVLLRIFCHAYGDRIVLLLHGYDKHAHSNQRRQNREIEAARKCLRSHRLEQQRLKNRP